MKFSAIIAEFNPFTYGHEYIIKKAKELTNNKIICIMSGNFVQRGEPAILDKYTRASHAINAGADIVIELPTVYTLSSAPDFAFGAVKILNSIKDVEYLVFGSECGNIDELQTEAIKEQSYEQLKENLNTGMSYASASANLSDILKKPNNILAVEYLRALKRTKSHIKPITIKREDNYNSVSTSIHSSASALRKLIEIQDFDKFYENAPIYSHEKIESYPFNASINQLIEYKAKTADIETLSTINGVSEGIENRIVDCINTCDELNKRIKSINTKRYPEGKIKRILCNMLLGISKNNIEVAKAINSEYIKVLAINKNCLDLLSILPKDILITSKKDYAKLNNPAKQIIKFDLDASIIYSIIKDNYHPKSDYNIGIKKI